MALKKPLVWYGNQLAQLQAGDTLDAPVQEVDVVALNNGTGSAIAISRAVYISSAGTVALAQANASATKGVIGLVKDTSIAASASGAIQTDGVLTASAAQWDAVIGSGNTGGLTPGATYYLSAATAGGITSTAPSTQGQYVVPIGVALSPTALDIRDYGLDILL